VAAAAALDDASAWANAAGETASAVATSSSLGGLARTPQTVPTAESDDEVTWGVQPANASGPDGRGFFDFKAAPGTVISDFIAVTNHSKLAAEFRLYAADATTDYDTAQYTLIGAEQASTDLGSWISVDSGPAECPDTDNQAEEDCAKTLGVSLTLGPGERRIVPFAVTVPGDATPGDHSAGVVASFVQQGADQSGNLVALEQRVGARVYLRVDGPLSPGVGVSGITASYDGSLNPFARGTATISFDVANTGNVRLTGAPEVRLTGPFGIPLGDVKFDPVANLLPGGVGHVTVKAPRVWPLFFLSAKVTVTAQPGDGDIAAADQGINPATGSANTWAVPWSMLGLIALVGAVLWFVLWRRRRSRQLLATELAAYTEQIRAEARGSRPGGGAGGRDGVGTSPGAGR
jgi:LPXTG-motif cell wall-anchored protein